MLRGWRAWTAVVLVAISGCVYVVYEVADGPQGQHTPNTGWSAVAVGDVDEDGTEDYALTMRCDPLLSEDLGSTWIISARDGRPLTCLQPLMTLHDDQPWTPYYSVVVVGDVDRDGGTDMCVYETARFGVPSHAAIYSGRTGALVHALPMVERAIGFDTCVTPLSDVDADGVPDLLTTSGGSSDLGILNRMSLVSGATGRTIRMIEDPRRRLDIWWSKFGIRVLDLGDVNGDGTPDQLIGSGADTVARSTQMLPPMICAFSGRDGDVLWTFESPQRGGPVEAIADADGDGIADLLIPLASASNDVTCILLSGRDGSELDTQIETRRVGHAGDTNKDGHPDHFAEPSTVRRVSFYPVDIWAVSGSDGRALAWYEVASGHEMLDCRAVCDIDGDGYKDVFACSNSDLEWDHGWEPAYGVLTIYSGKDGSVLRVHDRDSLRKDATRDFRRIVLDWND